jgi:hypothetical protein
VNQLTDVSLDNKETAHFSKNIQWAIDELEDSIENDECSEATAYTRSLVVDNLRDLIKIILLKRSTGGCYVRPT